MTTALIELGWDDTWAQHPLPPDTRPGRVIRTDRDRCTVAVVTDDGLTTVTATHSGPLRRQHRAEPTSAPVTGDWVAIHATCDRTEVAQVLPRRTVLIRPQVDGSSHDQALAANANVVAILVAATPTCAAGLVERMLALAWGSGARPVVVLTKSDLVDDAAVRATDLARLVPGTEILVTSATTGVGLEVMRSWLADGATVALLGVSGAGKSTLLNALVGRAVMRTQGLQTGGTGRHTTVTRELHLVPGGGAILAAVRTSAVERSGPVAMRPVHRRDDRLEGRCGDRRVDPDPPEHVVADHALDVCGGCGVLTRGQSVLGVVEHLDPDADAGERGDEGRDRTVALTLECDRHAAVDEVDREPSRPALGGRLPAAPQREASPRPQTAVRRRR